MAKRFIDTGIFDDPWFMGLSISAKVFWLYCITKCDHAGILEMNEKLCKFQTGIKGLVMVTKELDNRLIKLTEPYYFIPKYIEYQYPNFPNSKVRQQDSAIKRLKEFRLFDEDTQSVIKGLINSYDNVSVIDNGTVTENGKRKKCLMRNSGVTQQMVYDSFQKTNDLKIANPQYYFNTASSWSDSKGEQRIDWIATVANFARRDLKDGKMQLRKKFRTQTEAAPDGFGEFSDKTTHMPESLKKKFDIK